jgi:CRP-like cAMP-binding protein
MNPAVFKNRILNSLDPEAIARLQLRSLRLPAGRQIENPGETIDNLFFIEDGIGSMTTTFGDGFQVEVGMFGVESVMGASVLVGTQNSLNKVYMQMTGYGYACRTPDALREFARFELFHDLTLRYLQTLFLQACQSAGCNAHHNIIQRLARWLLLCGDRSESLTLSLTHEYLADMLGSNRSTVSVAAEHLQYESLIQYTRGKVVIMDRAGLELRACECYRIIRNHLNTDRGLITKDAAVLLQQLPRAV